MRLRRLHISGLLLLALCACIGSRLGEGDHERAAIGITPISEIDYIGRRADAECAFMARCCVAAGLRPAALDCEGSAAVATAQARPNRDGDVAFQGDRAAACVAALEHAECAPAKLFRFPEECNDVYARGARAVGEPCSYSAECAQSGDEVTSCIASGAGASGVEHVCGIHMELHEGDPCVDSEPGVERVCGPQLWCNQTTAVCEHTSGPGGACSAEPLDADTCGVGALCERVLCAARRGTQCLSRCITPPSVGSECEVPADCEGWTCVGGVCRKPLVWVSANLCVP